MDLREVVNLWRVEVKKLKHKLQGSVSAQVRPGVDMREVVNLPQPDIKNYRAQIAVLR